MVSNGLTWPGVIVRGGLTWSGIVAKVEPTRSGIVVHSGLTWSSVIVYSRSTVEFRNLMVKSIDEVNDLFCILSNAETTSIKKR